MESSDARGSEGKAGVRLFGVTIIAGEGAAEEKNGRAREWAGEEIIRKSRSMSNLAAAADPAAENAAVERGYLSEGGLQKSGKRRRRRGGAGAHERKKGVPWTEEEHRTFLEGLEKLGKGDWRGISKKFVLTRTPTQVASHAQKYFIRQTAPSGRRRRSSLFDVVIGDSASTSEAQKGSSMEINLPPLDGKRNEALVAAAASSGPPRTEDFLASHGGASEPSGPHPLVGVSGSMRRLSVSGEPGDPPQLSLMLGVAQGREGAAVPSCAPPRPHHRHRLDRSLSGHLRQTQYVE